MGDRWDIFCKVVDNYGDIGVAWRLARILASEHELDVRLWVDDLAALARIWPAVSDRLPSQRVAGVQVQLWSEPFPRVDSADVVIETFQCAVPQTYVESMAARPIRPSWINLDYLSAETWISGCHGLPSPHPLLPLTRYFYFPGFDPATGGLLHERGLEAQRATFLSDPRTLERYWARYELALPARGELRVNLFCYPQAPVAELFSHWARGTTRITALMPAGAAAEHLRAALAPGSAIDGWIERGAARLKIIPFCDQTEFDRLLWACHVNFVRGEDSFVRAQWARRAFVWNIYPQGENAHWIKLHAFLDRYTAGTSPRLSGAIRHIWRAWNGLAAPGELSAAWECFAAERNALARHATRWAEELACPEDLAAGLVKFCARIGK